MCGLTKENKENKMNKFLQALYLFTTTVSVALIADAGGADGKSALVATNQSAAINNCGKLVSATPLMMSGINGYISPALGSRVEVSAQQNGTAIRLTRPNAKGEFLLNDLVPGQYDVVFTAPNFATAVITDVPIPTPTTIVAVSTTKAPIDLQPAIRIPHNISGLVTLVPISKTEAGYVTVKQSFIPGPTVTVKCQTADLLKDTYEIRDLPSVAPQLGQYTPELPIIFVTQNDTVPGTGKYSAEASANRYVSQTIPSVDVRLTDQFNVNFTLEHQ